MSEPRGPQAEPEEGETLDRTTQLPGLVAIDAVDLAAGLVDLVVGRGGAVADVEARIGPVRFEGAFRSVLRPAARSNVAAAFVERDGAFATGVELVLERPLFFDVSRARRVLGRVADVPGRPPSMGAATRVNLRRDGRHGYAVLGRDAEGRVERLLIRAMPEGLHPGFFLDHAEIASLARAFSARWPSIDEVAYVFGRLAEPARPGREARLVPLVGSGVASAALAADEGGELRALALRLRDPVAVDLRALRAALGPSQPAAEPAWPAARARAFTLPRGVSLDVAAPEGAFGAVPCSGLSLSRA